MSQVEMIIRAAVTVQPALWEELDRSVMQICDVLGKLKHLAFSAAEQDISQAIESAAYLNDIACTAALFLQILPEAAFSFFADAKFVQHVVCMHDEVLPLLEDVCGKAEGELSKAADFDITSTALVDVAFAVVQTCIINRLKGTLSQEAQSRAQNVDLSWTQERLYSLVEDMAQLPQDMVFTVEGQQERAGELLRGMHMFHDLHGKLQSLLDDPHLDDSRMEDMLALLEYYVAPTFGSPVPTRKYPPAPAGLCSEAGSSQAVPHQSDSKAAQVRELFPDLGDGFIDAALAHFNGSAESVINAMLEGALPAPLASLDQSMARGPSRAIPARASQPPAAATTQSSAGRVSAMNQRSIYDGDALFTAPVDKLYGKLWQGKKAGSGVAEEISELDIAKVIGSQWDHHDGDDEYDDDYDDSFDDVNSFSVQDGAAVTGDSAQTLGELTRRGRRPSVDAEEAEEAGNNGEPPHGNSGKGKGRGKGGAKLGTGDGRYGAGRGQVKANARKEQNKAKVANHNRKAASSRKARI